MEKAYFFIASFALFFYFVSSIVDFFPHTDKKFFKENLQLKSYSPSVPRLFQVGNQEMTYLETVTTLPWIEKLGPAMITPLLGQLFSVIIRSASPWKAWRKTFHSSPYTKSQSCSRKCLASLSLRPGNIWTLFLRKFCSRESMPVTPRLGGPEGVKAIGKARGVIFLSCSWGMQMAVSV